MGMKIIHFGVCFVFIKSSGSLVNTAFFKDKALGMIQHIRLAVAGQGQSTSSAQRIKEFAFLGMKGFALGQKSSQSIEESSFAGFLYAVWYYFGTKRNVIF